MPDSAAMPAPVSCSRPQLTSRGTGLMVVSLTAVVYGFVMQEPGSIHLGLLGLILLGGCFLWAGRNLRDLSYSRNTPESAFVGQLFPLTLTVTNHRKRLDAFAVEFDDIVAGPVERGLRIDWLQAGESATREMQSRMPKRGLHHETRASFESMFPLGLWKSRVDLKSDLEMTVFPRPIAPKMLEDPDILTLLEADEAESSFADWQGDFHGLREFQPGDRMKLIHWPASTRSRQLVVRQFDRRLPSKISILFHSIRPESKPLPAAAFESAMELLCGMLLLFRDRNTPVDMIASFNDWQSMRVDSDAGIDAALRTLAVAKRRDEKNFDALHAALAGMDEGHRVIVLSDVPLIAWESAMMDLPCMTICLSIREMFIRQPRMPRLKPVAAPMA